MRCLPPAVTKMLLHGQQSDQLPSGICDVGEFDCRGCAGVSDGSIGSKQEKEKSWTLKRYKLDLLL